MLLYLARLFSRRKSRETWEFRLIQPDDKALGASPWIWDHTEAYRCPQKRPEAFCGALRSPVSCSSRSDLAVRVDLPEMMLDRSSSIASTLGGSLKRELRVVKATRIDHQASWIISGRSTRTAKSARLEQLTGPEAISIKAPQKASGLFFGLQ